MNNVPPRDPRNSKELMVRRNPTLQSGSNFEGGRWADGTYGGETQPLRSVAEILAEEEHIENPLREYWRVIVKYRLIIGLCVLLGSLISLVVSFTITPRYSAQSKIRISTYLPVLAATKVEDVLQEKSKEANYLETQIEELRSFSLADRVLGDPQIGSYFTGAKDTTASGGESLTAVPEDGYRSSVAKIKRYLASIEIKPVRRTSLVVIEATAQNPQIAARIAQRHATEYIEWVRGNRVDQQSRTLKFLREQADELRIKVTDLEREMADYAEANAIVAVNKDENIVVQKMAQLNQMLTELTNRRLEAQNLYQEAKNSLTDESAGFDDQSTQQMRSQLATLEAEYQQLSAKFMPGYPRMQQLRSQIEGLRSSIQSQRKQVSLGLKAKADALFEQEGRLREELEQQKSRAFELSKKQVQYNSLNRELSSSRDLLENVLRQMKETSLSVESNSSNVSVIDSAVVPESPSFPKKRLMVLVGLLCGGAVGLIGAFVMNYLDNSLRTPEDISTHLKLPSLGLVPSFDLEATIDPSVKAISSEPSSSPTSLAERRQIGDKDSLAVVESGADEIAGLPVLFLKNPRSLAAEAYRTVRTGIILSQAGEPPRTLLVTSAQSSEGKTTSSVNLAASLASSGARVVLIEADLRRPSIHKHFNLPSGLPGLVDVITGQRTVAEVAVSDRIKRVTLIPAGKIPPNPAELLGSYEMLQLLERFSSEYDYVVVDSPPILPVTDSVVLSRFVDGVVLVVRAGSTPRKIVSDAKRRLVSVGARVLGVVLNDVDFGGGDYYYYNRYYASYYHQDGADGSPKTRVRRGSRSAGNAEGV